MNFLQKYSAQTHAIAAGLVSLIGSYYLVPQFKAFVDSLAALIPNTTGGNLLKSGIVAGVALILHYRQGTAGSGPGQPGASKIAGLGASMLALVLSFCLVGCSVQSTLVTVEKSLPTAVKIATSVLAIVNGAPVSAGELADINSAVNVVNSNLSLAQSLIDQYNTTLKSNPSGDPGIVAEIDAAIAAIQSNTDKLGVACIGCNDKQKAALQFVATTVTGVVEEIISLLPAQHAAQAPHALARIVASGSQPGAFSVPILDAKQLAKKYNAGMTAFPHAQIQVP